MTRPGAENVGIVGDGVDADSDVEGDIIRVILAHILKSTLIGTFV
jgi:hypothetical protein